MSEDLGAYLRRLEDRAARLQKELGRTATLRDQFAMAALTGLVVANYGRKDIEPMDVASWAYGISDAMLEARK